MKTVKHKRQKRKNNRKTINKTTRRNKAKNTASLKPQVVLCDKFSLKTLGLFRGGGIIDDVAVVYKNFNLSGRHLTTTTNPTTNPNNSAVLMQNGVAGVAGGVAAACSPVVEDDKINAGTCLTPTTLEKLRDAFNKTVAAVANKITEKRPEHLYFLLKQKLQPQCGTNEKCWLDILPASLKTQYQTLLFPPEKPKEWKKNPNEWLSNFDISNVLKQYETKYKCFHYFEPSPIDYDAKDTYTKNTCVSQELCEIQIPELWKKGKKRLGIIFNLSKHTEKGSHWVALYVDLKDRYVFYFDSTGVAAPVEVKRLISRIQEQCTKMPEIGSLVEYDNRDAEHQKKGTECGVYCLFFIITMLTCKAEFQEYGKQLTTEEKLRLFQKGKIPDEYVQQYRNKYFS